MTRAFQVLATSGLQSNIAPEFDIIIVGGSNAATVNNVGTIMSDALSAILGYIKDNRKLDFSVYRTDTIKRRLQQRIAATGCGDPDAYFQFVLDNPAEVDQLINTLTITTSHFFRNPIVFDVLAEIVLPELLAAFPDESLRIWCAGCGRGEEAYSLAILISELTRPALQSGFPATIIASDIDRKALCSAAEGLYEDGALGEVRKGMLERYFVRERGSYKIADNIRAMVSFVYHDITTCRPPKEGIFSDYHLILCRNVLIYLNREMQEKILQGLESNLRSSGYLVLGEAEMITGRNLVEVYPRTRIFRKGGRAA